MKKKKYKQKDYKAMLEKEAYIKNELYSFLIHFNLMSTYQIFSVGYRAHNTDDI